MKHSRKFIFSVVLAISLVWAGAAWAEEEPETHWAGILIDFGEGHLTSRCVPFTEESLSGYELLNRAGVAFAVDASSGMGAAICQIGETGCPGTDCFCQCKGGGACAYWTYWQLNGAGEWGYAQAGASQTRVLPGQVQAWRWGDKASMAELPAVSTSFAAICHAELAGQAASLAERERMTTAVTPPPDWSAYVAFGVMVSLLGLGLVWVRSDK
jgi:hypothetical protein